MYNYCTMGLTTDFERAKEFLEQVDKNVGSSGGIFLLKLDEETGEFKEEDFVGLKNVDQKDADQTLRKLTQEEIERSLPRKLFVLNVNGGYEIKHRVFVAERCLLENLRDYHEGYGELFSPFGSYDKSFAAYVLFDKVIEESWSEPDMSFDEAIEKTKLTGDFIGEVKMGEVTDLAGMEDIGEIYVPRIGKKNLRKAFDFAKQYVKIVIEDSV